MTDFKEEAIARYVELESQKKTVEKEREGDTAIKTAKKDIDIAAAKLSVFEHVYNDEIEELNAEIENIRISLQTDWDIEDKTYKCAAGSATIRSTKALVITDNGGLIDRLTEIFSDRRKAYDCIRTFDLTTIRKYMDVNLIAGHIAHYDKKQSMIIKGAR